MLPCSGKQCIIARFSRPAGVEDARKEDREQEAQARQSVPKKGCEKQTFGQKEDFRKET
jgi:hypothetical protein